MRHRHLCGCLILAGLALIGCPPTPAPLPPSPDASDAAPGACSWDVACASLAAASCPLGAQPDCATTMARDIGSGKVANATTGRPMTCADIAAVKTKLDAQNLGFACK